ncbi:Phosphoribosylformylglycinamidine synthase, glutamine amidotransferase subunit [hydrothermal vent metagenome]|uniref:Phosphoribosylformylglycinamidine synthase, glutamine amidotransferase subunit n=1 Tax=hydrothermal vent metagenome TaxID=652676 RepID=A0A3B0QQX3_9ZZZZ
MKFAIIVFPGSNCDHDCYHVVKHVMGQEAEYVWHKDTSLEGFDCVILPGGFSYGDYLRTGSIARFSPVMAEVGRFAAAGGLVLGICNGFQILCEAGLLPGVLMRNRALKFICKSVPVRVESSESVFTSAYKDKEVLSIPVAHADGNYFASPETIKELEDNGRVLLRYSTSLGDVTPEANPNGSLGNIAGITSERGNVLGLMPHPERASEAALGNTDGKGMFESIIASFV